ncbi:MAG: hypothetical protein PWP35_1294 [Bacteroidales bacterium]|jgi:polyisoprenoid-binding protein YceI|nr:hypothetical protein [Bacteroidales bacterium]
MKKLLRVFSLFVIAGALLSACSGSTGDKAATGDAQKAGEFAGEAFKADTTISVVEWEGSKPGGKHNGTISLKSGEIYVENGNITGGRIVIDMHSIVNLDIQDPEYNQKLVGHLKSADFFSVDSFPEAYFTITSVKKLASEEQLSSGETVTHEVSGNLKIKNIEKGITFKAKVEINDNIVSASAPQFIIDRSEWKIKYGSRKFFDNLKDKFIYDEIGLKFTFVANK